MSENPRCIICLSGKRKSGKDYFATELHKRIPGSIVIHLSGPIKRHWAKVMNLDFQELLTDSSYKEQYRQQMIAWSEEVRLADQFFFCRSAIDMHHGIDSYNRNYYIHPGHILIPGPLYSVWIISDVRRKSDCEYFRTTYPNKALFVRLNASEEVRVSRGYEFQEGVDDSTSECDLDHVEKWDFFINNDGNAKSLETHLKTISSVSLNMVHQS